MSEQTTVQPADTQENLDQQIRQAVMAWLTDIFHNGKYRLVNHGSVRPSRDHYLEVTNTTNVNLRELRVQLELYKEQILADTVTAKTGADGIRAGQTGQLTFFTKEVNFTAMRILPDTVTYKADWVPGETLAAKPEKKGIFGRRKKPAVSDAFRVGTGEQLAEKRNEYVQQLEELRRQAADEEIQQGLEKLIPIVESIFRRTAEVPGSETEIKRLTDRYLPMIITSTQSYLSYAKKNITGEDMEDLRGEVISGIGLVSEACGNLLNRLYEDGIVDAAADVSVLKMLLKQDGLLGSDFEK